MGTVPKPPHGSIEWLQLRHTDEFGQPRVSASEAAAVHGEHRFKTKWALAAEKLLPEPIPTETTRAMERGNRLENAVIAWLAADIGQHIEYPDVMYTYDEGGASMIATLDGYIGDNKFLPDSIVEIKTYNREFDPDGDYGEGYGPLPAYWHWQGVQQSMCANTDHVIWGVLDSTLDLKIYHQFVSDNDRKVHRAAVADFCRYLSVGLIPDEWERSYDDMSKMQPVRDESRELDDVAALIAQLREVQADKRELSEREDEIKAILATELHGATVGTVGGQEVVTWKQQSRTSFDAKSFASDHPDLHKQYTKSSTYRVMRLKGGK